jgi:O-antigen/teichoic acid export membrane protein
MAIATQRFINVELLSGIKERINRVFSMSVNIHVAIACIVILLSETVGLWFLNSELNVPDTRVFAANVVYQISILTTLVSILQVPYISTIIAHERMSLFAVLGITDTIMKLIIVYLLLLFPSTDLLILYSLLLLLATLITNTFLYIYCRKKFYDEIKYVFFKDRKLFLSLFSFSSWNLFGQSANLLTTQGINIMLNLFWGVAINAAAAIANQVNGAVFGFVSNAQTAFQPQIIQTLANGERDAHITLVLRSSRFSFFLIALISTPILLNMNFLFHLWLGEHTPEYAVPISIVIILNSTITALAAPFWISANAVGKMKKYQLTISSLLMLSFPFSYLTLKMGGMPYSPFIVKLIISILTYTLFRIWYFRKSVNVQWWRIKAYFKAIAPIALLVFFAPVLSEIANLHSLTYFILLTVVYESLIVVTIGLCGLSKGERMTLIGELRTKFVIKKNV